MKVKSPGMNKKLPNKRSGVVIKIVIFFEKDRSLKIALPQHLRFIVASSTVGVARIVALAKFSLITLLE